MTKNLAIVSKEYSSRTQNSKKRKALFTDKNFNYNKLGHFDRNCN